MEVGLRHCPGRAVNLGVLFVQPGDAAPDDLLPAVHVSVGPLEDVPAVSAVNDARQGVLPAVNPALPGAGLQVGPADHLLLRDSCFFPVFPDDFSNIHIIYSPILYFLTIGSILTSAYSIRKLFSIECLLIFRKFS